MLTCLLSSPAYAQNEVTASIRVLPPYPTALSDYVDFPEKTLITLRNNTRQTLQLQLTGSISGENGIDIRMSSLYKSPQPIMLAPLAIVQLNADAIRALFDADRVILTGISKSALIRGNGLPEGIYTICLRALDYQTGEPLSPEEPIGCSNPLNLTNLEPPYLIRPVCGEESLTGTTPQNLIFTWSFPAGAPPSTEYTLRVVEMIDPTKNPNDAFLSSTEPAFFEQTVTVNAFLYGPAQPTLVAGRRYAYAITARDPFGKVVFRNGGRSEICSFVYQASTFNGGGGGLIGRILDKPGHTVYTIPRTTISGRVIWRFRKTEKGGLASELLTSHTMKTVSSAALEAALQDPNAENRANTVNSQVFGGQSALKMMSPVGSSSLLTAGMNRVNRLLNSPAVGKSNVIPVFGGGQTQSVGISGSSIIATGFSPRLVDQLTDDKDAFPLVNQKVSIVVSDWLSGGKVLAVGRTDQDGRFSIDFVNPNDVANASLYAYVYVRVEDPHFVFPESKVPLGWKNATLNAGTVAGIAKTYRLYSQVQDDQDASLPMEDVKVEVFRPESWYAEQPSMKPEGNFSTTSGTPETVNGLPMLKIGSGTRISRLFINNGGFNDRYYVRVSARGYEPLVTRLAAQPQGDYENSVIILNQTYKLQARLPRVYGRVTRSDNQAPLAGVTVVVTRPSTPSGTTHAGTVLGSIYNYGSLPVVSATNSSSSSLRLAGSLNSTLMQNVYRVNSTTGNLVFGHGVSGALLPSNASLNTRYVAGSGSSGNLGNRVVASTAVGNISTIEYEGIINAIPKVGREYATAVTDAEGNYSIADLKPSDQPYEIYVTGQNVKSSEPGTVLLNAKGLERQQDLSVNMNLVPVTGRVVNDEGQTLSNARISWKSGGNPVFTGPDGRFSLPSLPGADVLSLRKIGHNDRDTALLVTTAKDLGTFVLNRLVGRLLVTVRDHVSNEAVAGATVVIGEEEMTQTTASNGQAYLSGNIGGTVPLKVRGPGDYVATPWQNISVSYAGDTTRITVKLSKGARVKGTVRSGGQPVAEARIWVDGREDIQARSGADGSYTLAGVPLGEYTLKAAKTGLVGASETRTFASGTTTVHFNLKTTGADISRIFGLPIEVEAFNESTMRLSGAFINLPGNSLFQIKAGSRLPFRDLKVRRVGNRLEPEGSEVLTDATEVRLKVFNYLVATARSSGGLVVKKSGADGGYLAARVGIDYAASLGNLAGWQFDTPDAHYLRQSPAAPAELTFLTSAGTLPYSGDSLVIGAAGNQQLKLYGFNAGLDLSKSAVKADGLHLRGDVRLSGIPLLSGAVFRLAHLWIGTDGTVRDATVGLNPAPSVALASWTMNLTQASLSENGFRLGGQLDVTIPSSPKSTFAFSNLFVSTDQLFGGEFTLPASGLNVFNIVTFQPGSSPRISFGQVGNTGVYFVSGNARLQLPKYIDQQLDIKNFAIQTDGRFSATAPANFRTDFLGLASLDVTNIRFDNRQSVPTVDVEGGMTLSAIPFMKASAGGIHFRPGGSVSVDRLELGFNIASAADIKVRVDFQDTPSQKGFSGQGNLKIASSPMGGDIRFYYNKANAGEVSFGADFMANIPPMQISPLTAITKVGGGFGYSYDPGAGQKKYRITVRGAIAVAAGTDWALALDPLEVTVESGPVIRGLADVTVLSQRVGRATLDINIPKMYFTVESRFGAGFLKDVGIEAQSNAILTASGRPGDAYWFVGAYQRINVLGFIRSNSTMAAGWNLNRNKHGEFWEYTGFVDDEFLSNGTTINGVHFLSEVHLGRHRNNAVCGDIADVAGACFWLYNDSEAKANLNLATRNAGISMGAAWGGGADVNIFSQSIAGVNLGASLYFMARLGPGGWGFKGSAKGHLEVHVGYNCGNHCFTGFCTTACIPTPWGKKCFLPTGAKICVDANLNVELSSQSGLKVDMGL